MTRPSGHRRVAIVGLGNVLLADDGVGVHALEVLRKAPPPGVRLAVIGTVALGALDLLEEADFVIAIDAVRAGGPPGTIYRFDAREADVGQRVSLHDLGVIGALRLLPDHSRPEVTVVGVEPERVEYGVELTPTVRAVLPCVVDVVRKVADEIVERGRRLPGPLHAAPTACDTLQ
jgi:hydrogenase maturation protease